ncbi:protein FAR1-RELATED SEQUENCE 2-like [Ipomoea triloba]|uniref:protein FAR1-RELATED SEQUENCE 2-like n=1 Tax=Ipomoea triloba TaxID=35885 RepID=UPI00125D877D|nr:protein FAR1-RELATED SEQUENCE 2-like [Ipomoea triloba]
MVVSGNVIVFSGGLGCVNMDSASGGCDERYSIDIGVEGSACDMEISHGMTKYWRPNCAESLKPHVGQQQSTTWKGRDSVVVLKQVVCSREGFKQSSSSTSSSTQSTVVKRRRVTNRVNRNLDAGHQLFVASCVRANIGPTRSYRFFKEIVGVNCEAFGFEYDVDDGGQLSRVFLADAVSRKNFSLFGDVVSFDATYRTNRYNLVFVPFTGIDNHKRYITFGVGLLTKEDIDSYVWLLESFKKIMGHDPICVVTDQDPAMKVAVAQVGEKVGPVLSKDEVFRRKLNGIVWDNSLDPMPLSLVEFLVHYDSAIGAQRHAQVKLNADCEACFPYLKTPLALERHAMDVYTISIFYDVQDEICSACFSCQVVSLSDFDGCVSYVIKDGDHRTWRVELALNDYCASCSCKMFERMGFVYLVHRWTKGACLHPIFHIDGILVDQSAKVKNVRDGSENGNGVVVGSKQSVINSFCGDVSMGSTVDVRQ